MIASATLPSLVIAAMAVEPTGDHIKNALFYLLLFLGCTLIAVVMGMVSSWIDRKVTALVQARVGPPPLQPLWDFLKLMGKETLIPAGANRLGFLLMPVVALAAVSVAATILLGNVFWQNGLVAAHGFAGDLIVVLYLLVVPSAALVIGASSSNNPFASVGASREIKLMVYELPLLVAVAAALTLSAGSEQRFTNELRKQVDTVAPAGLPLRSRAEVSAALARVDGELAGERANLARNEKALEHAVSTSAGQDVITEAEKDIKASRDAITLIRDRDAALRAAFNGYPEKPPLAAGVPLRFQDILALRGAGPGTDADVMNKRTVGKIQRAIEVLGGEYRREWGDPKALKLRLVAVRSQAGDEEIAEIESKIAEIDPLWQPVYDLEAFLAGVKSSSGVDKENDGEMAIAGKRLRDGAAGLAAAARGRSLHRGIGLLALVLCVMVAFLCAQAKLGLVPFDCAEAGCEIAGGVFIEYGGPLLAVWKLTKAMLLFTLPVFIGVLFLGGFRFFVPGGGWGAHLGQIGSSLAKYVLILVFFVLVRNTNPRVRIDQAMRFFLGPVTALAALALLAALVAFSVG